LGSLALARALALAAGCEDAAVVEVRGPLDELRLRAYVDVARTAEERRDGLVGREGLAPSEGLLLEFPVEGEVCIQNGLVSFAVDAVFVDANDHVVAVEALPAGDPWVWCHAPVARVLEVAGRAALSVHVGDVLERRP
jgi:uncharacterized membrane protein (UPF0127 family)